MAYQPLFSSKQRDYLWSRECLAAWRAGRGRLPICNICDTPVQIDDPWDESHDPAQPRVFGGKSVGIAHRGCNHRHGYMVVKPQVDKCDRVRARHLGLKGPGLGRYPMKAGRRSAVTKTMNRGVKPRLTLGQRLAALQARRFFIEPTDTETRP